MSPEAGFRALQARFAGHIRDPDGIAKPDGVAPERMQVYVDLFYNNIEGLLAGFFPVLRQILDDPGWHGMVRGFIRDYRCRTPYFLEIAREFLAYLNDGREQQAADPPFLRELAHYEWVELALNISEEQVPDSLVPDLAAGDSARMRLSPLAWALQYSYPVHRISPESVPDGAPELPTFLVVYRNREDSVRFLEINGLTFLLLEQLRAAGPQGMTFQEVLAAVAGLAPDIDAAMLRSGASDTLVNLAGLGVVGGVPS